MASVSFPYPSFHEELPKNGSTQGVSPQGGA